MCFSQPTPPDPRETAGAQTANNVSTAIANQVMGNLNQITPSGSLTYYFNGPNGELIAPGDYTAASTYTDPAAPQETPATATTQTTQAPLTEAQMAANERGAASYEMRPEITDTPVVQQEPVRTNNGAYQLTDPNTGAVYDIPQMTAVQTLTPEEQAIFDADQASRLNLSELGTMVSGQMQQHFANPFSLEGLSPGGSAANLSTPQYTGLSGLQMLNTQGPQSNADQFAYGFDAPSIGVGIGDAGEILRDFGEAGDITRTYGSEDNYESARTRVEEALMSRLNPSLERDRESLRTSLLGQGIREGSEAYDRAMNRADEAATDARFQAILAGGQEQSRLDDLEARRAGFENAAQQQEYEQLYGRAQFSNNAQQQQFGQNRDAAQLSLQGQIASSNQALQQAQIRNQALQAAFGQDMASAQFGNQAIMGNNALMFDAANFDNNLADRTFANDLTMQNRMDADRSRDLQEMLLMRNQPINEIGALLGTGQVSQPNFVGTNGVQIPTVDRAGLEMSAYQQELAAWQQQQAMMGGLLGSAGSVLGAGIGAGWFQ